ncbi:MAG: DUF1552 domain-containing protein [Myxococcales bacterium]|nr:DUF1552 domain-containing protein [Myxococcales bacterium]
MSRRTSRRAFLGGLGAAAITLPFWRTLRGEAQGPVFPKRLLLIFSPNGTWPDEFFPDGGERDFTMRRILAPLDAHRDRLLIFKGVDQAITYTGPGDGHQKGMGCLWTGVELLPGDTMGGCDSCPPVSWSSGMSVDQRVAMEIGNDTRFRSLELGVDVGNAENVWTRMVYRGPGEPLPPEDDPMAAFERIFGDLGADPLGAERRRTLRQSVLDYARGDFERLAPRLGRADRTKLESHMEAVREIERRLTTTPELGAACVAPSFGEPLDITRDENNRENLRRMSEMMTMAFACDLTRVGSIQWNNSVGQSSFPWLGFDDRHHDLSHEGDSNGDAVEKIVSINTWYAEQLADLLTMMEAIPEGDGTLLDNTLVVWGNELAKGNSHERRDMPFVLAGGGGGFEMGRYLTFDRASHCDLLTSILAGFGIDESFGDPRYVSGPLI